MQVEVTSNDLHVIAQKLPNTFGHIKRYEVVSLNQVKGFWGDHYILNLYNEKSEKFDLFLKAVPRHIEKRMEILQETGFFKKEMKIYEHFVPPLLQLSSVCWAPMVYLTKEDHFIVMENLRDFCLYPSQVWDYRHFELATKTLASMHSSGIIYVEKFGKLSASDMEILEEVAYPQKDGHIRCIGVENGIKTMLKLIQLIPKYKKSSKLEDILQIFPEIMRKIFKFVETSSKYQNIILHGDIWVNNVMFKYNEKRTPIECKYIDFQFSRYGPPALDLATFFYSSSTTEFRDLHLKDLLNIYCNSIEKELKTHNIDSKALLKEEILESFEEYRLAGLIESAIFNLLTLLPSDVAMDMMSSSEEYEKFFRESREEKCLKAFEIDYYKNRMTEILSEIIDNYVLPSVSF